jgi:hypothetical protein
MKTIKYILLSAVLIGFTACNEPEDIFNDNNIDTSTEILPDLTAGTADFSNYVAIGASFTAGYTDGALFIAAQENSFPNTLSKQFANANGGAFNQPLMNDNIGGFVFGSTVVADPRLYFDGAGPALLPATPTTDVTTSLAADGSIFKNVGIPGAKSTHIDYNGYASLNPYFGRIATSADISMLEYALAQNPTFFTLSEIGGNDVLGYATTGGDGTDPITPTGTFDFVFNDMVNQITAVCPNGVVTNVPYITDLPHFTAVPYNPIPLDAGTASQLNAGYASYNGGLQFALANNLIDADEAAARTIVFQESANNSMVLIDEDLTDLTVYGIPSYRQSTSSDLFVLRLSPFIPQGYGTQIPLEDKWVLIPSEQAEIRVATDAYNATIANVAQSKGLALVDLNAILNEAATSGVMFDNYILSTDLVLGGLVSLDGIHLNARGYAYMANAFLAAIDETYGSNFVASGTVAKAGDFPTNYSPLLQ